MGAKNSKVKKGEKKGAAGDESSDQVDKTATLPASFKKKEVETGGKTETLPRNLNRSTSFTNSCRNWAKKKGLVKDKSPNSKDENETPTKTREEEVKENGTRKSETKETITPVVAKLAQKKARAQFFEEMYNSSGMSVSSSLTPEKPKRLCDMNLPSPRIGPGSPTMDKPKVEQIVEMIEEKEKLNRSIDSEANSSLNRSMEVESKREVAAKEVVAVPAKEADNMVADAASPKEEISEEANIEVKEDLIQAAKEETDDVIETIEELQEVLEEKKDIEELQEILEDNDIGEIAASGEASKAWEEAKEEMLENVEESSTMDETLPSSARLEPVEPAMQTQEEAKEEVEEVGEVKEVVDDKQCSLEKEEEEEKEEEPKAMDNGELAENVIAGGQSSEEEEDDLVKEESCSEEKQGGALGLRRELEQESGDEKEEKGESESTGVDGN